MRYDRKVLLGRIAGCVAVVVAAVLLLTGVFTGKPVTYFLKNRGDLGPVSEVDIEYLTVEAPEATSRDGTVSAKDWEAIYPDIVATMGNNARNSYVTSYLEEDPYLVNIYEGYGFAKDYGSARGHAYTLEDVAKTERPHAKANCLTCKTPNFARMVNDQGVEVYSMPFDEVMAQMEENISCYTCHGNDAGNGGQITITHSYVNKALGEEASKIDAKTLSCGQCHIEYYFTPEDSETMMPYHSVEEMTPEAILAYYDELGFSDWVQPGTGTPMLKAQHPEMETFLQGKHASLLTCGDCHMPLERSEDGVVYHSHELVSPLENETLLASCATCHEGVDMVTFVHGIQDRVTAREKEVGNRLSELKDTLAEAVAGGKKSEAQLDEARKLHRAAQWYFDYCYVENSEGAHNSSLAISCLSTSEGLIDEAMAVLAVQLPEKDPETMMRTRPVIGSVDGTRLMRERPEATSTDASGMMRARPVVTSTDSERLMRARPEATMTDGSRLMRERPEVTSTDSERLMRTRPEATSTDGSALMRERPEATSTDSERLMRTRPEATNTDGSALMREHPEVTSTDSERLMRTQPEVTSTDGSRLMRTRPTILWILPEEEETVEEEVTMESCSSEQPEDEQQPEESAEETPPGEDVLRLMRERPVL